MKRYKKTTKKQNTVFLNKHVEPQKCKSNRIRSAVGRRNSITDISANENDVPTTQIPLKEQHTETIGTANTSLLRQNDNIGQTEDVDCCRFCSNYTFTQKVLYRFLLSIEESTWSTPVLELTRELIPHNRAFHIIADGAYSRKTSQTDDQFYTSPLYFPFHAGPSEEPLQIVHRKPLYTNTYCPPSLLWSLPCLFWAGSTLIELHDTRNSNFDSGDNRRNCLDSESCSCVFSSPFDGLSLSWYSIALLIKVQALHPWLLLLCKSASNRSISRFSPGLFPYLWRKWCDPSFELASLVSTERIAGMNGDWYFLDSESEVLEGVAFLRGLPRIIVEAVSLSFPMKCSGVNSSRKSVNTTTADVDCRFSCSLTIQTIHNHWIRLLSYIPDTYLFLIAESFGITLRSSDCSSSSDRYKSSTKRIASLLEEKFLLSQSRQHESRDVTDEERRSHLIMSLWCAIRFIDHDDIPVLLPERKERHSGNEENVKKSGIDYPLTMEEDREVPSYFIVPFFLLCRSFSEERGENALRHQTACFTNRLDDGIDPNDANPRDTFPYESNAEYFSSLSCGVQRKKKDVEDLLASVPCGLNDSTELGHAKHRITFVAVGS